MVTKSKKKKVKKRKPKGKSLSEALEKKEARRAKEEAERAAEEEAAREEAAEDDALESEPPPAYDDDDAHADDDDDDDDTDEDGDVADDDGDDDDDDPPASRADDDDDDDEEWDDDEDLAAAQMGHQRYVIAGFFGLWIIVGYVLGRTLELIWSRLGAKDWFVESVPQLAAIPHEGDLISRASISLVLGALIGGGIVLRYYTKPDVRQWADEVAEQLTHVKWPTREEVSNNTVVVMVASFIITLYLTLLDRFWGFVTDLIYRGGA